MGGGRRPPGGFAAGGGRPAGGPDAGELAPGERPAAGASPWPGLKFPRLRSPDLGPRLSDNVLPKNSHDDRITAYSQVVSLLRKQAYSLCSTS